jgi:hypothetical protein
VLIPLNYSGSYIVSCFSKKIQLRITTTAVCEQKSDSGRSFTSTAIRVVVFEKKKQKKKKTILTLYRELFMITLRS